MGKFRSCCMCSGLFIRSDAKFTCWCNQGYYKILADASEIHAGDFVRGSELQRIRNSFKEGRYPHDICNNCIARLSDEQTDIDTAGIVLHVEPTNNCNLYCDSCLSTVERMKEHPHPRHKLSSEIFEKIVRELKERNIKIAFTSFCGYGEPAMNPELPELVRIFRKYYPDTFSYLDTNASLPQKMATPLANCGLNLINLGIDGSDQATYEPYRKNGDFSKCIAFLKELVITKTKTGSPTEICWKYILFAHNDSDESIKRAIKTAAEIGCKIVFHQTCSPNKSLRPPEELATAIGSKEKIEFYLDKAFLENL